MHLIRLFFNSFRVRLVLAIATVVAMALSIVLIALPRQLDGYFAQQDVENLGARTDAMTALVVNPRMILTPADEANDAVIDALEVTGFVHDLTQNVALADVEVSIAPG